MQRSLTSAQIHAVRDHASFEYDRCLSVGVEVKLEDIGVCMMADDQDVVVHRRTHMRLLSRISRGLSSGAVYVFLAASQAWIACFLTFPQ